MKILKINFKKKYIYFFLLGFGFIIGALLRLYNLNWGAPFYFHPDERNIAYSVSQLIFPNNLNPHFFAYGSFPIYVIYSLTIISNIVHKLNTNIVSFENAIIFSRVTSAFLSILLIPLLYFVGKELKDKTAGIFAFFLAVFSVGFIQFAHFGTFEMWITTLSLLLFYISLRMLKNLTFIKIIFSSIVLGLLISTKVSSLALIPIPIISILFSEKNINPLRKIFLLLIVIFIAAFVLILTSPFSIIDHLSFRSSMQYESSVALGTLQVFYTDSFIDTTPILFQFEKIYPFLLNPFITIIFPASIIYVFIVSIKNKIPSYRLLLTVFSLLFFSQAFFFAKWTRYMVPTLPFAYLIISIAFSDILKKKIKIGYFVIFFSIVSTFIFSFSYFKTAFVNPDTRIQAALFAKQNIKPYENILSEVYDLGIIAFNPYFYNIKLFNFYDLDNNNPEKPRLSSTNYIILPSQRILESRINNPQKFPKGYNFYKLILSEKDFTKIYETPCDIFCKITYLNNPTFSFEYTANIFDRPAVYIFKKSNIK